MVPLLIGAYLLENKQYNEDSTPEEIQALENRVCLLEDDIILFNEVPVITPFSAKVTLTKLNNMVVEHDVNSIIIVLENAKAPSFQVRSVIEECLRPVFQNTEICCFVSGKNKLINIAAKFVLKSSKFTGAEIFVLSTKEEAIKKIHDYHSR